MNCSACATGADKTLAATIAAAINLEFMSIILPLSRPEIGRTPPPGQPIQMTHARRKSLIATPLYLRGNLHGRVEMRNEPAKIGLQPQMAA
ncbi:hypothetical protein BE61_88800 [Bradyrhizobium elkanii USDA 61]|nr:hypothetical protein BE61_88800 [Bradyrhizobium elkanii USDA 61]